MPNPKIIIESLIKGDIFSYFKKLFYRYGAIRVVTVLPTLVIYITSYALLNPEYKTPYQLQYENLKQRIKSEKEKIKSPVQISGDLYYYGKQWKKNSADDDLANSLISDGIEHLFKSISYLKDIQDNDENSVRNMIRSKLSKNQQIRGSELTEQQVYESINNKGEYYSRLFEQLFTQHGLKRLGSKYTETDVDIFFNILLNSIEEKTFRRMLGALVLNAPYYLVIKNSINEYYQNNDVLIPVDLYSLILFMMYLDKMKAQDTIPTIEECRRWVFSVIVPDDGKHYNIQTMQFSVQSVIREEMIMPNPGYFSKAYNPKKHKAIDIASLRGTMIRSPVTGTVTYYEQSPKKYRTGNFIIIKDEKSHFNIFICHMDNKDYIEEHSTEGELAEPIANLTPDWVHPLKKGQFFQVVGNLGKSTGAHTHIQIARRTKPYTTFDFFAVNRPYQKQFNSYLYKNGFWHIYSRNEQLLLSALGMAVLKYNSTRHFSDRDPDILELYRQLQLNYTPVTVTIDRSDLALEEIPDNILQTYFSKNIQEKTIDQRYEKQLKYNASMTFHFNYLLKLHFPLPGKTPEKTIPVTPWLLFRRKTGDDDASQISDINDNTFYYALNKYFLYLIMKLNSTPGNIRDRFLSNSLNTGNTDFELPSDILPYPQRTTDSRIHNLEKFIQNIIDQPADVTFVHNDGFCESIFNTLISACDLEGMPLASTFGFFRYHMTELQNIYQSTKFMHYPETREFNYNEKYDNSIQMFVLDLFELAAESKYYDLFRRMYLSPEDIHSSLYRKISNKIQRHFTRFKNKIDNILFKTQLIDEPKIPPYKIEHELHLMVRNIIKPVSFNSRQYRENTYFFASFNSLFYSLIYEIYLSARVRYKKLFPEEQINSVIDAIGLFDNMLKVFCDNAARRQIIKNEHTRITRELEQMEHELDSYRKSKKILQDNFIKTTSDIKTDGNNVIGQYELFSNYFTEEEKISKTIAYLEQSLDQYRAEYNLLKIEKEQMEKQYGEKLETINREVETLKSRNIIDHQHFIMEIDNITYQKEKAENESIELRSEIIKLEKENRNIKTQLEELSESKTTDQNKIKSLNEKISDINIKYAEQEKNIKRLENDLDSTREKFNKFIDISRSSIGPYAKELTLDELSEELQNIVKSSAIYHNAANTIKILQDQQKSDKRSLALSGDLITELRDKIEKLEIQLRYLRDTTPSAREKDLEEENYRLTSIIMELRSSQNNKNRK